MASNAYTALAINAMLRSVAGDATQAAPGVIAGPGTPGLVSQTGTASQNLLIKESAFVIPGSSPATNGAVLWTPGGGDVTKAIATPNGTNPRIDLVTAQVTDPGSSSTPIQADLVFVAGTPAASPSPPALPAGALLLATVNVPSGVSSVITNAMITDNRVFTGMRGAILYVPDRAKLSAPQASDAVYETNTGTYLLYDGAAWNEIARIGKVPDVRHGTFTINFSGGAASGTVTFPNGGFAGVPQVMVGCSAITGNTATVVNWSGETATKFDWIARPAAGGTYTGSVTGKWMAVYG